MHSVISFPVPDQALFMLNLLQAVKVLLTTVAGAKIAIIVIKKAG